MGVLALAVRGQRKRDARQGTRDTRQGTRDASHGAREIPGVRGIRGLLRPSPLTALSFVAFLNAVTVWLLGFSRGGLDLRESCERDGHVFDDVWNGTHYQESQNLFPLHAKCGAAVDLVPAWVNPAIVFLLLLSIGCLYAAVHLTVRENARGNTRGRKKAHV
ncbi:hypothetical protein AB0O07_18355 [Streptomyces sp. NPDC093085]|uniref:hypothetical protein n=1 Tax=Streptomyces sp. NPDC093085 TaxID=3155068 RepID=UPI0034190CC8